MTEQISLSPKKGKRAWRNPVGFASMASEDWAGDVADRAERGGDEEQYTDPAHWEENDDEEADVYYAVKPSVENRPAELNAYIVSEWQ